MSNWIVHLRLTISMYSISEKIVALKFFTIKFSQSEPLESNCKKGNQIIVYHITRKRVDYYERKGIWKEKL